MRGRSWVITGAIGIAGVVGGMNLAMAQQPETLPVAPVVLDVPAATAPATSAVPSATPAPEATAAAAAAAVDPAPRVVAPLSPVSAASPISPVTAASPVSALSAASAD
jgi:hypothetical protein